MFKIICEFARQKPSPKINSVRSSGFDISFKNCQPCDFSDYILFHGKAHNATDLFIKADKREYAIKTIEAKDEASKYVVSDLQSERSVNKYLDEYSLHRLEYTKDLSSYRYIGIFDVYLSDSNSKLGINWLLYHAVIQHIQPQGKEKIALWWNKFLSFIYQLPFDAEEGLSDTPYNVVYEGWKPLQIHNKPNSSIFPGTIEQAVGGENQIAHYFLEFLFTQEQNTAKCRPIVDSNKIQLAPEQIYENYKLALPELIGGTFLRTQVIRNIRCETLAEHYTDNVNVLINDRILGDDPFIDPITRQMITDSASSNLKEILKDVVFSDERMDFVLKSTDSSDIRMLKTMKDFCVKHGGEVAEPSLIILALINLCKDDDQRLLDTLKEYNNELFSVTCDNFEDVIFLAAKNFNISDEI